ncbi:RNA-binding protein [Marinobacter profundi]|uniref:Phosphodiesterase n=1 Tax=Marinobacter profundi TaxID=2666256 RepID=A0A2G1UP98_9GAMM|nr:hypothetical protein [Marinobacter profundi]PHQ16298.1 hypothetical protein CLH61_04250 [Marinobacter profundi]
MRKMTMTALGAAVSLTVFAALPVATVSAEEVRVPVMSQADRSSTSLPRAGQSQDKVRASFGAPRNVQGPVGEPPITQWDYPAFTVYFEYDKVIHTVMKRGQ